MRSAAPPPRLITWRATTAPACSATSPVPSREPSSTTSTAVGAAADLGRKLLEDDADVLALVVGGDEDRDLAAEVLGVAVAAEALPGEALEDRLELARHARALRQRPQDQHEQDQDREDRDADDPGPVLALEGEGGEDRVEELRARDERQAERDARAG